MAEKSVLAIQSHVVHGYVGNRAATFPLQVLGWDVDALNTVNLSNHTGYGSFAGTRASAAEITDLYKALKSRGFVYNALLTGYAPSAEVVGAIREIGVDIKRNNPALIWLLDPVLGDRGKLYVSELVVPEYKRILLTGEVSIITPNAFEAETLTGMKLNTMEQVQRAIEFIHTNLKVPHVVISSIEIQGTSGLTTVGSTRGDSGFKVFSYTYPSINSYFTGTGDLFAALLLDRFHKKTCQKSDQVLPEAVGEVLGVMSKVLNATLQAAQSQGVSGCDRGSESLKHLELRIIKCRNLLDREEAPLKLEWW